ncbi:MAG: 3'-5' exonuclease [Deinococcales bacterium]
MRQFSGFAETGEAKAEGALAFIRFSARFGSANDFLTAIKELQMAYEMEISQTSQTKAAAKMAANEGIIITTAFRAKGLQWPFVIVPDCNKRFYPFDNENRERHEEERRLFYVAITRTRCRLDLHSNRFLDETPFLKGIDVNKLDNNLKEIAAYLSQDPYSLSTMQLINILRESHRHYLKRYLGQWWRVSETHQQALAKRLNTLFHCLKDQDLLYALGLDETAKEPWQSFSPEQSLEDFGDLSVYLPRKDGKRGHSKTSTRERPDMTAFYRGALVKHPRFGVGKLINLEETQQAVTVEFKGGMKKLSLKYSGLEPLN